MRHDLGEDADPDTADRHALFWPPTKIAGRYLSPYLAGRDEPRASGDQPQPSGELVELHFEGEAPAAASAVRRQP